VNTPIKDITHDSKVAGAIKYYLKAFGDKLIKKKIRTFYLHDSELATTARRHRIRWCGKSPVNDVLNQMLDEAFEEGDKILIHQYEITKHKSGETGYYYVWKVSGEPEPEVEVKEEPRTWIKWHPLATSPKVIPNESNQSKPFPVKTVEQFLLVLGDKLLRIGFEGYEVYEIELDSMARSAGFKINDRSLTFVEIHHMLSKAFNGKRQIVAGPYAVTKGFTEHGINYTWTRIHEITESGGQQLLMTWGEDPNGS
jgi:hypothetical protein